MKIHISRLAVCVAALFCSVALLAATPLFTGGTTVTAHPAVSARQASAGQKTFQAVCQTSSGTGTAVISVEGSNNAVNFDPIGTVTLTLSATSASDSFTSNDRYDLIRGNVTTLTGTGASCSLSMGY